jgi:cell division protein FtsB
MKSRLMGWVILIVGLVLAVKTAGNIVRLWKAGGRVSDNQNMLQTIEKENAQLKERLEAVKSEEFVEKEARDKLGYVKPGEELVIIPKAEQADRKSEEPKNEPNWVKWQRLYFGN